MLGHWERCEEFRDLLPKVTDVPDVGQLPCPWNGVYLHKWVHEGYIPHVKLGRLVRFREATVLAWVDKCSKSGRTTRCIDVREVGV